MTSAPGPAEPNIRVIAPGPGARGILSDSNNYPLIVANPSTLAKDLEEARAALGLSVGIITVLDTNCPKGKAFLVPIPPDFIPPEVPAA